MALFYIETRFVEATGLETSGKIEKVHGRAGMILQTEFLLLETVEKETHPRAKPGLSMRTRNHHRVKPKTNAEDPARFFKPGFFFQRQWKKKPGFSIGYDALRAADRERARILPAIEKPGFKHRFAVRT